MAAPSAACSQISQTIPAQALEPQQKILALISGTSKRAGKTRNPLGKYLLLLK